MYEPPRWLSLLLGPAAAIFEGVVRRRNAAYDAGRGIHKVAVPVISVGNLTVGGTGKTPLVIELVRRLRVLGRRPAVLTRGYAGRRPEEADEVREIIEAGCGPVVANPDRVAGAAEALGRHAADILVLDDGFQHRRLARDLDLVLIDALDPWGGGRLLPAGRLREPLAGLRRAGFIVLSRANLVTREHLTDLNARLDALGLQQIPRVTARIRATAVENGAGQSLSPDALRGRSVHAVCGLGNPQAFLRLVDQCGAVRRGHTIMRDHHHYRPADVTKIARRAAGADLVLTTGKDWVKLRALWPAGAGTPPVPLLRLRVVVELEPEAVLDAALARVTGAAFAP